jgi:hypothetical protein
MEPTLREAIQVVFGVGARGPNERPMPEATPRIDLEQVRGSLAAAEQALGRGDWQAFGRAMQELRQLLTPDDDVAP